MLVPDAIDHFDSNGERLLYFKFKNDKSTNGMYILHSLFTNYHFKNISGELDFLVIAPNEGVFAIEVKHGGVSRKEGTWSFVNRNGEVTKKTKSPFAQVDATMNSIRNYVLDKVKSDSKRFEKLSKILWGTGIAFTSMEGFIDFGPEGYSWQILTKQGLKVPASKYILSLSKNWHYQNKGKYWYDAEQSRPTKEDCELLLQILRGDFDIDYRDINIINDNEHLIESYTKEQFALLDFVNYNKRCLIEGAAGTGKTLMAIETSQRKLKDNCRVGLFCYNKQLGAKLKHSTDLISGYNANGSYTGTLHSYLSSKTSSAVPELNMELQKYFNEDLPFEFLDQNEGFDENEKFDVLIIDEAQDLINPYYLEVFDMVLKGGIKHGQWILFGDFSNQAIYLNQPIEIIDLLNSKSTFAHFPPLKVNCRNTKRIASQNTLVTGVEMAEFRSGGFDGESVATRFPAVSLQKNTIEEIVAELMSRAIPLEKIVLLSPKIFNKSVLKDSALVCNWIKQGLKVSTIHSFKGLESIIVVLYDFDEINSINAQRLFYTGISRAKQELYIVLNKNLKEDYYKLISLNYLKLK